MATYKGILTNNGKALLVSATVANPVNYSHLAVGDGNGSTPTPLETRSALVNEKARIALNVVEINPNQTNQIICEAIIPTNIGGFNIREFGLFAGSVMIVNGNYPLTYKPAVNEGGAREIAIKVIINVQNAEVVALYLDDSLIYATREWVKNNYISRADIIDNLTTNDATKPVSAKQAKLLQDSKAAQTTTITAGTGLSGGGNLSANRTLSINFGTTAGTAAQGNDSRIVNAVQNVTGKGLSSNDYTNTDKSKVNLIQTNQTQGRYLSGDGTYQLLPAGVDISGKVDKTLTISTGTGLSGGGNLSANRTLSVIYGTTAGTAAQGNDARILNGQTAFGWGNHASVGYALNTNVLSKQNNLSDINNIATARVNLGLGTAATFDAVTAVNDDSNNKLMMVGSFGVGKSGYDLRGVDISKPKNIYGYGLRLGLVNGPQVGAGSTYSSAIVVSAWHESIGGFTHGPRPYILALGGNGPVLKYPVNEDTWTTIHFRTTMNTTADSNGFIKSASPIVQLYSDKIELNEEAQQQNIVFEKLGTGDYIIKNSTGFSNDGWYIEQPRDANGNIYHAVVHEQLENGDISIKTYECKLNEIGQTVADLENPIDIKENRFITLRLNELPQDTTAPQNPNVVDSDDKPAPSKYHYLEDGKWKITAENEVILENERYAAYQASLPVLTRRQFKLALLENNLLGTIESAINSIEDNYTRTKMQIEYQEATTFHRTSESVIYMCELLQLSNEQVDTMWEAALLF